MCGFFLSFFWEGKQVKPTKYDLSAPIWNVDLVSTSRFISRFLCTLQNTHTRAKILYPSVNLGPIYMKNNLRRAECEAISTLWWLCCAKKAYQDLQDANQSKPDDQLHTESIVNPCSKTILQTINGALWSIIAAMLCWTHHRHWLSGQAAFLQQARKFTTSNDNCRP